jgi:hypothetical protein
MKIPRGNQARVPVFCIANAKWNDLCPKTGLCGEKPATDGWPTVFKLCDVVKGSVFTSVVCFNNTTK